MNTEKMDVCRAEAAVNLCDKLGTLQEHAEHFVTQQMESMISDGQAFELTEDEERLLRAYRRFCSSSKKEAVFSWRPNIDTSKIVMPAEVSLIRDPCEVTE